VIFAGRKESVQQLEELRRKYIKGFNPIWNNQRQEGNHIGV
jgi:hypothetical protein